MTSRRVLYFSALWILLLAPFFARAASERVLWDQTRVDPAWQVVASDARTTLEQKDGNAVLKSAGESYLVYRAQLRSREFDRLIVELRSNTPLRIELIPNISTIGKYTFELRKHVGVSEIFDTFTFSLKHPWFTETQDFAIKFSSSKPAEIGIQRIALRKAGFWENTQQFFADYFRVAPYEEYTVNLLPTPLIFGRSAFVFFLPIFALLCLLYLVHKQRKIALMGFLILWLVTDVRMHSEFLHYYLADYRSTHSTPPFQDFRSTKDLYAFLDWARQSAPASVGRAELWRQEKDQYIFGIAQYSLYPLRVRSAPDSDPATKLILVYDRPDIRFSASSQRLYRDDQPITTHGRLVGHFGDYSLLFAEE